MKDDYEKFMKSVKVKKSKSEPKYDYFDQPVLPESKKSKAKPLDWRHTGGGLSFNDWLAKNQEYRNDTPDLLQDRYADYKDDLQRRQQAAYNGFNKRGAANIANRMMQEDQFRMRASQKGLSPETIDFILKNKIPAWVAH